MDFDPQTAGIDPETVALVARQATDAMATYRAHVENGSLAGLTDDEATMLAGMATAVPEAASEVLGADLASMPPKLMKEALLSDYYDACATELFTGAMDEQERIPADMKARRERTMFRNAGVSQSDAGRIAFDRENGDSSAYLALQERYFLG